MSIQIKSFDSTLSQQNAAGTDTRTKHDIYKEKKAYYMTNMLSGAEKERYYALFEAAEVALADEQMDVEVEAPTPYGELVTNLPVLSRSPVAIANTCQALPSIDNHVQHIENVSVVPHIPNEVSIYFSEDLKKLISYLHSTKYTGVAEKKAVIIILCSIGSLIGKLFSEEQLTTVFGAEPRAVINLIKTMTCRSNEKFNNNIDRVLLKLNNNFYDVNWNRIRLYLSNFSFVPPRNNLLNYFPKMVTEAATKISEVVLELERK